MNISFESKDFLSIGDVKVGHWTDDKGGTGVTVLHFPGSATCGVDTRGSATGTREVDLLYPTKSVQHVDAIVLTGGSALGLSSASGIAQNLRGRGQGYETQGGPIPIVPAAVIFDLTVGDKVWPQEQHGYLAIQNASSDSFATGNVGGGTGATAGPGMFGCKTGLAVASVTRHKIKVGAIVIANPLGTIIDANGSSLAGLRENDHFAPSLDALSMDNRVGQNTVIGCVITNAAFGKAEHCTIAEMAHDGIARSIYPSHTSHDGDVLFSASPSSSDQYAAVDLVGSLAAQAVAEAIRQSARQAETAFDVPNLNLV